MGWRKRTNESQLLKAVNEDAPVNQSVDRTRLVLVAQSFNANSIAFLAVAMWATFTTTTV